MTLSQTAVADMADAQRVHAYLRAMAERSGAGAVGPFAVLFSDNPSPFANYAIPRDFADPSPAEVAALIAAFRARDRKPRLEYVPAAAPAVEAALTAAGFEIELRPPLMTRRPDGSVPPPPPPGFDLNFVDAAPDVRAARTVQREAFGEAGAATDAEVAFELAALARGRRMLCARDLATGEIVGVGGLMKPRDAVTEVVGIGVRPAFQRRGLGQAIADGLARAAFEAGCALAFLSAKDDAAGAVYLRVGFERRMPMLFMSGD
jgi:RimJ/RimL family protein N-acetyltransferase